MPARRRLVVAVVVAAALLGSGTSAWARGALRSPLTPPALPGGLPTTTSPPTSTPLPSGIDVGQQGDHHGAANGPDGDVEVEPADPDQVNEVLLITAEEARARRDAIRAELDALLARIDGLEADVAAFEALTDELVELQRMVARRAVAARRQMLRRAVGAYVAGGQDPVVEAAHGAEDLNEAEERRTIVTTILEADQDEFDRLLARRLEITSRLSRVLEQAEQSRAELRAAQAERGPLRTRLKAADVTLEVVEAGSDIVISGFVFPVADPHTFSSTFGAPRSGGRTHQGADIFAPMGTPLVASERGIIDNMGTGSLGGIKLWLVGESGTEYYYAHLIAYADGITDGRLVEAGDVIGYVGNTGNAISTPPHLHYEIHPGGGDAIDPYPLLHAVDTIDGENLLPPLPGYGGAGAP